jgi:hypothetical protein
MEEQRLRMLGNEVLAIIFGGKTGSKMKVEEKLIMTNFIICTYSYKKQSHCTPRRRLGGEGV